ncbi:MAG: hypothetical protein WBD58_16075 [Geitlerinemataceae cyanobacterium]
MQISYLDRIIPGTIDRPSPKINVLAQNEEGDTPAESLRDRHN